MGTEIERKFLVTGEFSTTEPPASIVQGYLNLDKDRCVRVRTKISQNPNGPPHSQGFLTIKGATEDPSVRAEFEYPIPYSEAVELLKMCEGSLIGKTRARVGRWEVDVFDGDNDGLVVAEIELNSPDEPFVFLPWVGMEVTHDPRYTNACLAMDPYKNWRRYDKEGNPCNRVEWDDTKGGLIHEDASAVHIPWKDMRTCPNCDGISYQRTEAQREKFGLKLEGPEAPVWLCFSCDLAFTDEDAEDMIREIPPDIAKVISDGLASGDLP